MKSSKRNEVSASEDEVDSEYEDDVDDAEGPTLVTVDDGKGGVKHVKVKFQALYDLHCILTKRWTGLWTASQRS